MDKWQAYLEPSRTSTIGFFAKIINGLSVQMFDWVLNKFVERISMTISITYDNFKIQIFEIFCTLNQEKRYFVVVFYESNLLQCWFKHGTKNVIKKVCKIQIFFSHFSQGEIMFSQSRNHNLTNKRLYSLIENRLITHPVPCST